MKNYRFLLVAFLLLSAVLPSRADDSTLVVPFTFSQKAADDVFMMHKPGGSWQGIGNTPWKTISDQGKSRILTYKGKREKELDSLTQDLKRAEKHLEEASKLESPRDGSPGIIEEEVRASKNSVARHQAAIAEIKAQEEQVGDGDTQVFVLVRKKDEKTADPGGQLRFALPKNFNFPVSALEKWNFDATLHGYPLSSGLNPSTQRLLLGSDGSVKLVNAEDKKIIVDVVPPKPLKAAGKKMSNSAAKLADQLEKP